MPSFVFKFKILIVYFTNDKWNINYNAGVPNRKKNGFFSQYRSSKGFTFPRISIYRIVGMLKQVRGIFHLSIYWVLSAL
jgi:hypothetical protein